MPPTCPPRPPRQQQPEQPTLNPAQTRRTCTNASTLALPPACMHVHPHPDTHDLTQTLMKVVRVSMRIEGGEAAAETGAPPRFPPMSPVFPRGPTLSREDGRPRWVPARNAKWPRARAKQMYYHKHTIMRYSTRRFWRRLVDLKRQPRAHRATSNELLQHARQVRATSVVVRCPANCTVLMTGLRLYATPHHFM